MKVYFDNCSLQRPLDDQTQPRIRLEAEAVAAIFSLCEAGFLTLVSSQVLLAELNQNSDLQRKDAALEFLRVAQETVLLNEKIKLRAEIFENRGFKPLDALHLACAEIEQIDFFCTCDDRLLKKAKAQTDLKIKVVSPLELAEEVLP